MSKNIEHMKEIVAMQQSYARMSGLTEVLSAADLVAAALRISESTLQNQGVTIRRDFQNVPPVQVDKHKALQVLVNLIRNAHHALMASGKMDKTLTFKIVPLPDHQVGIQVCDNGQGIALENVNRIFQHGFTTKRDGHGFGLHSSANAAREMRGNLSVQSNGLGSGATFTLELPVAASGMPSPPPRDFPAAAPAIHHKL